MGGTLRINSSFMTVAAFGITAFSLSTIMYALQSKKAKVTAGSIGHDDKHSNKNLSKWDFNWDHRNIDSRNNSIRCITLIRHGQYVHSMAEQKKILTDLGRKQAKITGEKLKSFGIRYDEIICSKMIRAKQTADIIVNELYDNEAEKDKIDIIYDSDLNEGAPYDIIPERDDINKSGFWDKFGDDSARISRAFETYIHRNDHDKDEQILMIGHGNVFRYFMCRVLQFPEEGWLRFSLCNCSITKFKIFGDGRISVECIGSDGHLTKQQLTFN